MSALETKPCGRGGCTGEITRTPEKGPAHFERQKFCTRRCVYLERARFGDVGLTQEAKRRGSATAGRRIAERRRKRVMRVLAEELTKLIPAHIRDGWTSRQEACVKALMARAWRNGYQRGQHARWMKEQTQRIADAYKQQDNRWTQARAEGRVQLP